MGNPAPSGLQTGSGTLTNTNVLPFAPYQRLFQTWGAVPSASAADQIDITATDVATATISVTRAHVDCAVKLNVASNVPLRVSLAGCAGTPARRFAASTGHG